RYELPLTDLTALCAGSGFAPFEKALSSGGTVRGLRVPGGASSSRKKLDEMAALAKEHGAGGIVSVKKEESGLASPAAKHLPEGMLDRLAEAAKLQAGDLLVIVADKSKSAFAALAALRAAVARDHGLLEESRYVFCCVTDFPLFGWHDDSMTWFPMNHPLNAQAEEDRRRQEKHPGGGRARAYDDNLNGWQVRPSSNRIHRADDQERVFRLLGIPPEEGRQRFGFLLDALKFGAPPHGGIALGL